MKSTMEELAVRVLEIPYGHAATYGDVGRSLMNPVSGLLAGKWMHRIAEVYEGREVPWWRVVGAGGKILTFRLGPEVGTRQTRLLEKEGFRLIAPDQVDLEERRFRFEWAGFE